MRPGALLPLVVMVGLLTATSAALATTMLPMSMADLVERSDVVARVRVGSVHVVSTPDAPFRITELELLEVFAGDAREGDVLDLWQRGEGRLIVLGDPWLQTGEEGLAFVVRRGERTHLTGLAQSWWRLEGAGQGLTARRDLSGLRVVHRGGTTSMPPEIAPWIELRAMVRRACEEAGR